MHRVFLVLLFTVVPALRAQPTDADLDRLRQDLTTGTGTRRRPEVDPKRIINDSKAFLKEREPEMTTEEYALYQKMTNVLTGNAQLGIKFLEAMLNEKEPPSPAFEFILGNACYGVGQYDKAEAHYRSGLKRYPTFLRAWTNLGVLYYSTERYADAIPCFSKAVELGDRDATTFGLLGYSLERIGNLIGAEMAYMQALGTAPENTDWKQGLLRLYLDGRQFGRAEALVRTLIRDHPADPQYWHTYANVLLSDHQKMRALAVLEIAATAHVAGYDELALLGDLYAEQQLVPEAIATYRQALALQPAHAERKLLQLAQALVAGGKPAEAEAILRPMTAPAAEEDRVALLEARVELWLAQKKWTDARRDADDLLRIAPLNGRALLNLGVAYLGENDPQRATFFFEAAYRIPATTYRAALELANLELKNRHYAKSLEYLEKAYGLEKSDAVADLLAQVKTLAANDS
jgi:tetratricopeptide (TPR) repeat protein